MNLVVLIGRLVNNPDVSTTHTEKPVKVARYRIAVPRSLRSYENSEKNTDFFSVAAFGSNADFAEKFLEKGLRIAIKGRLRSGSYINQDGIKIFTTTIVADNQEFADRKRNSSESEDDMDNPFEKKDHVSEKAHESNNDNIVKSEKSTDTYDTQAQKKENTDQSQSDVQEKKDNENMNDKSGNNGDEVKEQSEQAVSGSNDIEQNTATGNNQGNSDDYAYVPDDFDDDAPFF